MRSKFVCLALTGEETGFGGPDSPSSTVIAPLDRRFRCMPKLCQQIDYRVMDFDTRRVDSSIGDIDLRSQQCNGAFFWFRDDVDVGTRVELRRKVTEMQRFNQILDKSCGHAVFRDYMLVVLTETGMRTGEVGRGRALLILQGGLQHGDGFSQSGRLFSETGRFFTKSGDGDILVVAHGGFKWDGMD